MREWLADLLTTIGVAALVIYVLRGLADAFGDHPIRRL
jgi:hypothetical protein